MRCTFRMLPAESTSRLKQLPRAPDGRQVPAEGIAQPVNIPIVIRRTAGGGARCRGGSSFGRCIAGPGGGVTRLVVGSSNTMGGLFGGVEARWEAALSTNATCAETFNLRC